MKVWYMIPLLSVSINTFSETTDALLQGKMLYLSPGKGGCASCHGETGLEAVMPMYPNIGGQNELYLYNQMNDYKQKRRKNGLFVPMEIAMQAYTEQEMKLVAKYLAAVND